MKQSKKKLTGKAIALAAAVIALNIIPLRADAAEFSVTQAQAVLYTNEETVIYADADENTAVLTDIASDLPIQVTGVTSNGYFQIFLGNQTFYVNGAGLYNASADGQETGAEHRRYMTGLLR